MRIVAVDWEDWDENDFVVAQGTTILRAHDVKSLQKQWDKIADEHTYCKMRPANKSEAYQG